MSQAKLTSLTQEATIQSGVGGWVSVIFTLISMFITSKQEILNSLHSLALCIHGLPSITNKAEQKLVKICLSRKRNGHRSVRGPASTSLGQNILTRSKTPNSTNRAATLFRVFAARSLFVCFYFHVVLETTKVVYLKHFLHVVPHRPTINI